LIKATLLLQAEISLQLLTALPAGTQIRLQTTTTAISTIPTTALQREANLQTAEIAADQVHGQTEVRVIVQAPAPDQMDHPMVVGLQEAAAVGRAHHMVEAADLAQVDLRAVRLQAVHHAHHLPEAVPGPVAAVVHQEGGKNEKADFSWDDFIIVLPF
jgi:hypothetical protein